MIDTVYLKYCYYVLEFFTYTEGYHENKYCNLKVKIEAPLKKNLMMMN